MEDVHESPCKEHSINLERQCVEKLLEIDENLSREVLFLGTGWERVGSGDVRKSPPTSSTTKPTKPRNSASTSDNMKVEIAGWIPDNKLVLRKPGKEKPPKPRDVNNYPHCYLRDGKNKTSNEQIFVFKHYKSIRKYIEEYRRQHSSVAKILSDYLASNLHRSIYQFRTRRSSSEGEVGTSGNPSHVKADNAIPTSESRQSHHSRSADSSGNGQPLLPHHACRDEPPSSEWTASPNARHSNLKTTKKDYCGASSSPTNKCTMDPSIIFKYKLAPNYVQSLLQHHQSLQKMGRNGTTNANKPNLVDTNNNSKCQTENDKTNSYITPGGDSNESRVHGVVTPAGSKSGQLSREGSAKQTLRSRAGGTVNLAPTKVTISSLPTVTVISKSKVPPSPLTGLDQENVAVEMKTKGNGEPSTSLPGGSKRTLDNLTCLVGGEKQDDTDSVKSEAISLGELSTTCLGEERQIDEEKSAAEQTFAYLLSSGLLQNLGTLVIPKIQLQDTLRSPEQGAHVDSSGTTGFTTKNGTENHAGPTPREKVSYPPAGRPPKPKGKRLVKYMSQEGSIRPVAEESRGDNLINDEVNLASDYLRLCSSDMREREKHSHSASSLSKSGKTVSDAVNERLVKSAMDISDTGLHGYKKSLSKAAEKRSKTALSQPKLKPPTLPFFKFWGGSLPPEARSHAKKQSGSRQGSALTCNSSQTDVASVPSLDSRQLSASSKHRHRRGSQKTSPAIASGV